MLIQEQEVHQLADEVMNMYRTEELETINNLHDAIKDKDIEKIDEIFKKLIASFEEHFQSEEETMEEYRYKLSKQHKTDHDLVRKKLDKFLKRWEVLKSPTELENYFEKDFKKWYIGHVSKFDSQAALNMANADDL